MSKTLIDTQEIALDVLGKQDNEDFIREFMMVEDNSFEDCMIKEEGLEAFVDYHYDELCERINMEIEYEQEYASSILEKIERNYGYRTYLLSNGRESFQFSSLMGLAVPYFLNVDDYRITISDEGILGMYITAGNGGDYYTVYGVDIVQDYLDDPYIVDKVIDDIRAMSIESLEQAELVPIEADTKELFK